MSDPIIEAMEFHATYEASKDASVLGPEWTPDYREGFIDGLQRAIEIVKEETNV